MNIYVLLRLLMSIKKSIKEIYLEDSRGIFTSDENCLYAQTLAITRDNIQKREFSFLSAACGCSIDGIDDVIPEAC